MNHDEVARPENGEGNRSSGWLLIVGIAVLAAVVSLLGRHRGPPSAQPRPTFAPRTTAASAPPTASATPAASTTPVPTPAATAPGPSPLVQADSVCPVVTDGRTKLTVTFVLRNSTTLPEAIVAIAPELPIGGLTSRTVTLQRGTCAHRLGQPVAPANQSLKPHATAVISLAFTLPKRCPAPYPVSAVVTVRVQGVQAQDDLPLFTDLGGIDFDLCRSASASS